MSLKPTVCAMLLLFAAAPASAQENEDAARHHFRLGQAHYESGAFIEAAHEFEQAYELSQRSALLHNIYVAYRDAGDLEHAADALRRFVESGEELENETVLRQRLAALEQLIAQRSGGQAPPEDTAPPPPRRSGGGPSPVGFAVLGVGAAMLIAGAITGGVALAMHGDLDAACPGMVCPAGYDVEGQTSTGSTLAVATDVLIPVGAVAAVTGVILLFVLQEGGSDAPPAGAACSADGCMGFVRASF